MEILICRILYSWSNTIVIRPHFAPSQPSGVHVMYDGRRLRRRVVRGLVSAKWVVYIALLLFLASCASSYCVFFPFSFPTSFHKALFPPSYSVSSTLSFFQLRYTTSSRSFLATLACLFAMKWSFWTLSKQQNEIPNDEELEKGLPRGLGALRPVNELRSDQNYDMKFVFGQSHVLKNDF